MLKHNLVKLYVHCEINETIEMTFKIETKLDTWNINCKFKKNFVEKKFKKKKKFLKKFFWKKFVFKKKFFEIFFFFKKPFFFLKIEFVKLSFQMQQNICKNQIGTKKSSFPRSPV